jgi:hypothetical protein
VPALRAIAVSEAGVKKQLASSIRVAIDRLGRIGRAALKLALRPPELKLVTVNASGQQRFQKPLATATPAGRCLVGSKACRCHPDTTFG